MRFLFVKLGGYAGIYNGLGLKELEIDFSKAQNRICVISGPNGVGKSTLLNALNLMPDDNSCFVPSMKAYKFIRLTDGEFVYDISIIHGLNGKNEHTTPKVSILKNGLELNVNGNVRSYKEIIENEFSIDSNYSVLSKIGGNDRGIADKTPAERKKIVSGIISSLEVYNNIYKVINKKTNTVKSFINNLSYKMQNIGSEESLRSNLIETENRYNRLMNEQEAIKESITKSKTIVALSDPDGTMQSKLEDLKSKYNTLNREIMTLESYIEKSNITDSKSVIEESLRSAELAKTKIMSDISSTSDKITNLKSEIEQIDVKINKANGEIDPNLVIELTQTRNEINDMNVLFNGVDIESVSKDEIDFVIKFCSTIVSQIDTIRSDSIIKDISDACNHLLGSIDLNEEYNKTIDAIKDLQDTYTSNGIIIDDLKHDRSVVKNLELRPDKCNIDSCPFIAEAVEVFKKNSLTCNEYDKRIDSITKQNNKISEKIVELQNSLNNFESARIISTKIGSIIDSISLNSEILSKFPVGKRLVNINLFLIDIRDQSMFSELRNMDTYREMGNTIIKYKSMIKVLTNLEAEYKIQQNTENMIHQYTEDKSSKQEIITNLYSTFQSQINEKEFTFKLVEDLTNKLDKANTLELNKASLAEKNKELSSIKKEITELTTKLEKSIAEITNISDMNNRLSRINMELSPISNSKKDIEAKLAMLNNFKQEYDMYKDQYNILEILRKYSSPTSGSIQSLFMSVYMDKTLDIVNRLLGMIFGGKYQIAQYIINENEFRIPFISSTGMMVDDISHGSTSQVCIMGMLINLVLFTTSSSKYNIVSLDEIDGGLDYENRYLFVNILQQVCNILNIDQLFIISHSVESALQAVDVVLLSDQEYYTNQFGAANVVYQYHK